MQHQLAMAPRIAREFRSKTGDRSISRGFTLLEILLACALATGLAFLMSQILRTALQESRLAADNRQPIGAAWLLREQLAIDITNARGYTITADSLVLGGFLGRDPESGMLNQQMALVTYRIIPLGNTMALQRSESLFAVGRILERRREIVWLGVSGIAAQPKAELLSGSTVIAPELQQLGLRTILQGLSVRMLDDRGQLLVEIQ